MVVEYDVHGRVVASGAAYENRFVSIVTVENHKIVRWRDYMDSLSAMHALHENLLRCVHDDRCWFTCSSYHRQRKRRSGERQGLFFALSIAASMSARTFWSFGRLADRFIRRMAGRPASSTV